VAVESRLRSDPKPVRNRDRLFASIRKKAKDTKGRYSDQDVVEKMHRKLKEIVERFTVSWWPTLDVRRTKSCPCVLRCLLSFVAN
jgi:hypothetical protein